MDQGYKVTFCDCETEFVEKKSRFLSTLSCVETEEQAKALIVRTRARYPDATHHCVAYRLWQPRIERFSDDGEPAGTAGMPMLEVMKKEDVFNVCVVVTRYFGGVLLGGGGLIRAYSRGVADALAAAGFAWRTPGVRLSFEFGYGGYARVEKYLEKITHRRLDCVFGERVSLTLSVPRSDRAAVEREITDLLAGDVVIRKTGEGFDSFQ